MKNLMKFGFMATIFGAMIFLTSCDDNEVLVPDPTSEYDGELDITEGSASSLTIYTTEVTATEIKALVTVTANGDNMKRIYITENVVGQGEEPFELTGTDNKADGSLDLEGSAANEYQFVLTIPILSSLDAGTVEYKIWATSGRGDYRDSSKRLLAGVGTLTINYGGSNPNSEVKAYTTKILAAPLADGSSSTFISLLDGQLYKINQGEEYSALWDFGYYYGSTLKASFAAAGNYPTSIIDVVTIAATTDSELNSCFFKLSTKTSADFDAISVSTDLNFVTSSANERINNLLAGDIVEFVDNYGKKGLIRVVEVKGTFNSGDYIKLDIKVQP